MRTSHPLEISQDVGNEMGGGMDQAMDGNEERERERERETKDSSPWLTTVLLLSSSRNRKAGQKLPRLCLGWIR